MPQKKKARAKRKPSRTPLDRIIGDLTTKHDRMSREAAANMIFPKPRKPSKLTLLFSLLLMDPEQLLYARGNSPGQVERIKKERKKHGISLEDGWTVPSDRQNAKINGRYLVTEKEQYREMKKLIRVLPPNVIETKIVDMGGKEPMTANRMSRSPDVFMMLVLHYLNTHQYDWFRYTHYCAQGLPKFSLITERVIRDVWPRMDEKIWTTIQNDPPLCIEMNHAIVYSMTEPFLLCQHNKQRYNQLKIILHNDGSAALAALNGKKSLRHIDEDQREIMAQTLSFLRFMQFTFRQRYHHYVFISTFKEASTNASIKNPLDALTTIVLPTIDEIIRAYEQTVLAEIQRTTKTQGGKVKKR